MATSPPKVPYVEALTLGEVSGWARAPKRALSRAGFMQWGEFTNVWGPNAVRACAAFQKAVGLKPNGTYTFATHKKLRARRRKGSRTEWAFDAAAIAIAVGADVSPADRVTQKIIDACDYAILHRDRMDYDQVRPMPDMAPPPNVPNPCDCSQFVTWCYRSGGAADPNGLGYNGQGFTGTLWATGARVARLADAKLADLVFYGQPWLACGRAHVAIVRQINASGIYVGSMGGDSGPLNIPADYRSIVGVRRYRMV